MANTSPPRFIKAAAPNRQAAIALAIRQSVGRVERTVPDFLRRLLIRLESDGRKRPE